MNSLTATESYLSLLLDLPAKDPMTVLAVFFLTLARLIPILAIAPFLGSQNVPRTIRMMFGVSLTAIFLPQNMMLTTINIPFTMLFVGLMLKELLIGAFLAILASVPFYIASMSGILIDFQRGASSMGMTDPITRSQTSPIGSLYNYFTIAMFFMLGGPILFFSGIATSYEIMPVDKVLNPAIFHASNPLWKLVLTLAQKMFNLSIQLAAPPLIGILLADMFLGIANRLAPQVQIVFLGIPLKSWVGLALLAAAWGLIIKVLGREMMEWFKTLNHLIRAFKIT